MQPHKLIRYAAIILLLFYFSTSYGFLDTCPKRNSVTDKCYEHDDKHRDYQRSERRVADVQQREVRLWRKEDSHIPSTNAGNRRVLDRNNNHITFQRERILTDQRDMIRERNMEIPDQLIPKNDRSTGFRSFNTISVRLDRMNTDRRNAGNSMQKPILKARVRRNLEVSRSVDVDKTAQRQKQRFSRIHEAENRRSTKPNSNEFRQHKATKERNSADVFREQLGLREAETKIRNSESTSTKQDKNGVENKGDVRNRYTSRQADRVLTDRKSIESDSRRSSVRAFDDRRRAFVRSTEDFSRFGDKEQISFARDSQQSSIQRESVLPDARRIAASSRSRREERTSFSRDNRQLSTRREIALSDASVDPSTSRREERSSYTRVNQPSSIRCELSLPDTRRNVIYSRSTRQQHDGLRRDLLATDSRQDTMSSRFRQEQHESRQPSIHQLTPTDVRRDSSSVFRHEARTRDNRLSSIRRELLLSNTRLGAVSLTSTQEQISFARGNRETLPSSAIRRGAASTFRREERITSAGTGPQFSTRRERDLSNLRRDAESSRFRQEEQSTFTRDNRQTLTRRLSPSSVRRDTISSTVQREEITSSTRDGRQSLIRQDLTHHDAVFSTFRKEGKPSFRSDERRHALGDDRRDASASMHRREIVRDRSELSINREHALSNTRRDVVSSRFRQEKEFSRTSIHRERTVNEDRRQYSNVLPTRQSRSVSRTGKNSIRREFGDYYERRQPFISSRTISSTLGVNRKEFSILFEVDGNEGRIRRNIHLPTSRTSGQHSINRPLLKVDDIREKERRQSPSHSIFLSNDRRRTVSPSRLHVNSRRLLNEESYSRTSFSERSKSEIRDNSDNFGYEQIQLVGKISQDWSNLAKTLLIALTLLQILAKTYPKKVGFQNLLHNSLGCVKQKMQ